MTIRARFGWLIAVSAIAHFYGCSSEEAHPPEFGSDAGAIESPRTCKEIRAGEPSGTDVLVDGQIANCVGEGVECSIADISAFDGICQIGKASAICNANHWQVECVSLDASASDASVSDASTD